MQAWVTVISRKSQIFENDLSSFLHAPRQPQQSGKNCLQFRIYFLCIVTEQNWSHSSLLFYEHQHFSLTNSLKVDLLANPYEVNRTVLVDEVQMIDHFSNQSQALNRPKVLKLHLGNDHDSILQKILKGHLRDMLCHEDYVRLQTINLLKIVPKNTVLIFDNKVETSVARLYQTLSLYRRFEYENIWEFQVGGELLRRYISLKNKSANAGSSDAIFRCHYSHYSHLSQKVEVIISYEAVRLGLVDGLYSQLYQSLFPGLDIEAVLLA
jgi:hypothetical protein